jgi:hypothetical protein
MEWVIHRGRGSPLIAAAGRVGRESNRHRPRGCLKWSCSLDRPHEMLAPIDKATMEELSTPLAETLGAALRPSVPKRHFAHEPRSPFVDKTG